jgi:hypothetical protein
MKYQSTEDKKDLISLNTEQCAFSFQDTTLMSLIKQNGTVISLRVKAVSTPEGMQKGLGGVLCLKIQKECFSCSQKVVRILFG